MPSFPGSENALPGVYTLVETFSSGLSLPAGVRLSAIVGEGQRQETIVAQARGGGNDGFDPTYSGPNGADGRHFLTSTAPIISNRTTLYKNGIPLTGVEGTIDGNSFNSTYDYKIDIETGQIELQVAAIVDQGGSYYTSSSLNVGDGLISNLQLLDANAPEETWVIRAVSILRDSNGDPIDGYARFVANGSTSGTILDGYGNVINWQSNGVVVDNGILSFSIAEGASSFSEGDTFTIKVSSGVLSVDDSLTINYIAELDLNDPEFFTDLDELSKKHGNPSTANRLSLGAQLEFANGSPGLWAVQAAPSIPRRVSYILEEDASGGATYADLAFALPVGVIPDADTEIKFFITDPVTNVESQIIPNKVSFYDATITDEPFSEFMDNALYDFSYTVVLDSAVVREDNDGTITAGASSFTLSSETTFDLTDVGKSLVITEGNVSNNGTYTIANVVDGELVVNGAGHVTETPVKWQVVDTTITSARVLFTTDLAAQLANGAILRAAVVDTRDADFFDVGWQNAYEALEKVDVDIVVPLPSQTISAVFQAGVTHVKSMSNIKRRKERVLFIGAIQGLEPDNVIGTTQAAVEDLGILEGIQGDDATEILAGTVEDLTNYGVQDAFGDTYRVVYFYPDEIVIQIGADRTLMDGFFIAAAAAGYLSGVPNIALPLTRKVLTGFTILRDKIYRPIILENLTAAGITVLQPVIGGGKVVRGQTTTISGYVEEIEISIVFIRDRIAKQLRAAYEGFIGQVDSPIFKAALVSRAKSTLAGFIGQGLITDYKDLKVSRNGVDPTQWDISVKVQPTYPVNFVFIRVGVGIL